LGQALRTAFSHCQGDYVVPLDVDLSYSPEHIEKLLTTIRKTKAKVVIASPYMEGGQVSNVPWMRRQFSIWANRFLSLTVTKDQLTGKLSTLTGMVRAYDRKFLSKLDLKAMDVDINSEILYKTMVLRGVIVEIPAHLSWKPPRVRNSQRKSNIRVLRSIMASLLSGFMFRPFMFFILSGVLLLLLSFYAFGRAFVHIILHFQSLSGDSGLAHAIVLAMTNSPLSFIIGGFTLLLGVQLISLGFLALQAKKYFEELFHLGTSIYGKTQDNLGKNTPRNSL
jgi:glycosyltransferase involved in cell wall biosynthesis